MSLRSRATRGRAGSERWRALAIAAVSLWGCERCGATGIAELVAASGDVSADEAPEPVDFAPARVGRRFVVGEAIRTAVDATADLALAGGGSLHVEPESIVRFSRTAETAHLDVEAGSTIVEASATAPLEIETVFGTTRLDAATRARVGSSGAAAARFEILVGHATLEADEGRAAIEIDVGEAVGEDGALVVAAAPVDVATPAPDGTSAAVPGGATHAVEVTGADGSVRAPGATEFVPLPIGSRSVTDGSVVRGAAGTTLEVTTADGRVRVVGDSELRLVGGAVSLARGTAEARGGSGTRLALPGGTLVLADAAGGSSARVVLGGDGAGSIAVLSGEARHEGGGESVALAAPDTLALGAGGVPEAAATLPATPALDGSAPEGSAPAGPAAVTLGAGESIVIHDPSAPTRVRFEPAAGCGEASWRFEGRGHPPNATSASAIVVSLRPGTVRYRARCADGSEASGSVRVDRDAGRAVLPRTAPRTVVDADGRPYSVLYQSLLPEIVFRWPRAPAGGGHEIEIRRGAATHRVSASGTSHTFASGELAEGTHTLTFRASDGSASPPTPVRIRFDNATPVATIRSPLPGSALGATAHVEGTAAEGASVSAGGIAVAVGAGGRFEADVPVPAGGCLSIRVAVAGRGVHHHVRCAE